MFETPQQKAGTRSTDPENLRIAGGTVRVGQVIERPIIDDQVEGSFDLRHRGDIGYLELDRNASTGCVQSSPGHGRVGVVDSNDLETVSGQEDRIVSDAAPEIECRPRW
jgi:hypothetical protein